VHRFAILVCRGPDCGEKRDSASVHAAFDAALKTCEPLATPVDLGWYSCFGRCRRGPNVLVRVLYHGVRPDEAREVIEEHVRNGRKLQALIDRNKPEPPGSPVGNPVGKPAKPDDKA
jgi:(2Fe-2S) ferredoxin